MRTLLMICLTWYIFASYGGIKWNTDRFGSSTDHNRTFCDNASFNFNSLLYENMSNNSYTTDWYILFAVHAVFQIYSIFMDFSIKSMSGSILLDMITIALIILTLVGSGGILWFVITILFVLQCFKEYLQIISSFPDYFRHLDNFLDMLQIALTGIILYYPI